MLASEAARISQGAMDDRGIHPNGGTPLAAPNEQRLRLLIDTGLLLASERRLDVIVRASLDAGLKLCGAAFGAFFYDKAAHGGEPFGLYQASGIDAPHLASLPTPWSSPGWPSLDEEPIVRSEDIAVDPRFARNPLLDRMPSPRSPVRSYLVASVRSRGGKVRGALVYGHPDPGIFEHEVESLVATIAAQAAAAIENAGLTETLTREIAIGDAARADQRSTSRRLHLALDAAQLGTWNWNARTGLIDFDERAAALFGVPAHLPVSRDVVREQMVFPEDLGKTPTDLAEVLRSGGQYSAEYRIRARDGEQCWVSANGIATWSDATGQITGMIGTVQDITSRKIQEETLRTSEKLAATGRLAATIAHEINNPLEAVTNLIYLAKTDPATPAPVGRLLETADAELARVAQIAQQTLGFYRDTTRPVTIDINDLLSTVVDLFGRKLTSKRLRCTLDLEPGLSVTGLQGEIRQVVSNLLVNAIEASPATGAVIHIRGRRRHRRGAKGIAVLISDEGTGIPPHVSRRLFSPFVTTKQSTGTGLGLWVTRGMVEKHGGCVHFRTRTTIPSGTIFRIYLPESAAPSLFAPQITGTVQ